MKDRNLLGILIIVCITIFANATMAQTYCDETLTPDWVVGTPVITPSEVSAGGIVSVTVPVQSNAQSTSYEVVIQIGGLMSSKQVQPGRTEELTLQITAPNYETSSQKTETLSIQVTASGIFDRWLLCDYNVYGSTTKFATYKWPTQTELASKQAQKQAQSAETAATAAIVSAKSAIDGAKIRINEAAKIGSDTSSATNYVNTAESDYTTANALKSSGNGAFGSGDYSNANLFYQQAKSKAESAQNSATNAKSTVDRLIEEYNKQKTEAQNKVSDAQSAINTAKKRIADAEKVIGDANVIGIDTAQSKADIATAKSKVETADSYYAETSGLLSSNNFDGAKSKAQSAISLANEAEGIATPAYNRLNERLVVLGASSRAIINASSEVNEMNDILTKMDYIIRSTEKWGVELTETKEVVETAKKNIDNAEDLLSQSKNRQDTGFSDDAVNLANQARDNAAASKNRLDTMTHTIALSTQDALEKAYSGLQEKITSAEAEIESAQDSYGATPNLIVDAKTDLASAKSQLLEAKQDIEIVNTATELIPLLEKADTAFKRIDTTEEKITSSVYNARSAKKGLTQKVAIGAAIVAAAGGAGFLYYRKRNKKDSKHKTLKTDKVEEETALKHCPKCKTKIEKGHKFCNACGEKLKG